MITQLENACPTCGCQDVRSESREEAQASGTWLEQREFRCGRRTVFVPKFQRVEVSVECDRMTASRRELRGAAKREVIEMIRGMFVGNEQAKLGLEWLDKLVAAVRDVPC